MLGALLMLFEDLPRIASAQTKPRPLASSAVSYILGCGDGRRIGDKSMRTTSLILALVMQSVMTVSLAQEAKTPVGRPIPEEHKNFVAEVEGVFRKFPKASARYKLTDFGENPVWSCPWDCQDWPGFVDCRPVCEPQR